MCTMPLVGLRVISLKECSPLEMEPHLACNHLPIDSPAHCADCLMQKASRRHGLHISQNLSITKITQHICSILTVKGNASLESMPSFLQVLKCLTIQNTTYPNSPHERSPKRAWTPCDETSSTMDKTSLIAFSLVL